MANAQIDTEGYCIPKTILPEPLSPLGGLVVTPAEMAKLLLWLVQPLGTGLPGTSLLSETSLAAMQMNHFPIGKSVRTGSTDGFPRDACPLLPPATWHHALICGQQHFALWRFQRGSNTAADEALHFWSGDHGSVL